MAGGGNSYSAFEYTVIGTGGNDTLQLPPGGTLLNTSIDGAGGIDTLDMSSYSSDGVFVALSQGEGGRVAEQPFTGVSPPTSVTLPGSIFNIENLIGTSGNDVLTHYTWDTTAKFIDGGPGNDYIASGGGNSVMIGGTGSDWLISNWTNNTLLGGADDGDLSTSDGVRDVFYLNSAPTILDFEVGIDHFLVELTGSSDTSSVYAPGAIEWRAEGTGAALYINGVREVTLANVDVASAQTIDFGVVASPVDGVVTGGPGNDMLFSGGTLFPTRFQVAAESGHDVVMLFNLPTDTLVFEEGLNPVWSNTIVNGATALVATFAGGSLTFQGLSLDDVDQIMIEGNRGTLASNEAPAESAWSVDSDFAETPTTLPRATLTLTEAGQDFTIGGDFRVYGTTSDGEVIEVLRGDVLLDASFNIGGDTVVFPGNAGSYAATLSGSSVIIAGGDVSVTIPVGLNGLSVQFADSTRTLRFDTGTGQVVLGTQPVASTSQPVAPSGPPLTDPVEVGPDSLGRLVLTEAGQDVDIGGNVTIFGTAAPGETISILHGTIILDPSFNAGGDTVVLPGNAASYTATLSGSSAIITGGEISVSIPVGIAGLTVDFADGDRMLRFDVSSGQVMLGDQAINSSGAQVVGAKALGAKDDENEVGDLRLTITELTDSSFESDWARATNEPTTELHPFEFNDRFSFA